MRKFIALGIALLMAGTILFGLFVWIDRRKLDRVRHEKKVEADKVVEQTVKTVGERVTAILKPTGLCSNPCPSIDRPSGLSRWGVHTEAGSLLVMLFPNLHADKKYRLEIFSVSPNADGTVTAGEPLEKTLTELLVQFGFPSPQDHYREFSRKGADKQEMKAVGPKEFTLIWPQFPGKERLKSQWRWSKMGEEASASIP